LLSSHSGIVITKLSIRFL
jgi:predicted nucleic acid-binding protein